jgi:hypothetical protein
VASPEALGVSGTGGWEDDSFMVMMDYDLTFAAEYRLPERGFHYKTQWMLE